MKMIQLFSNNSASTLASGVSDVETALTLAAGEGANFPAVVAGEYFLATLVEADVWAETAWEVVKCTARSGDVLTVERAQDGTPARAWASATKISLRITAATLTEMRNVPRVPLSITGNTDITVGTPNVFTLSVVDAFTNYSASAVRGTVALALPNITYTPPATGGTDTLRISTGDYWRDIALLVAAAPSYNATPAATPAIGAAFEGGAYAGLIWQELVQSTTSTAIGTGSKTFSVADMTSTPLVYVGQTLEVRSRANPENKLVGTVTSAAGTDLILNISSVAGAGTFTDWSIMSQYRLILSDNTGGQTNSLTVKNANTALPDACKTLANGAASTAAMVAAGDSTVYPAAWFCHNLTLGGYSDWYMPARDEIETAFRNLRPDSSVNFVGDRMNLLPGALGDYPDTALGVGINRNSVPPGAAYTTTDPARTTLTGFYTGGAYSLAYNYDDVLISSTYRAPLAPVTYNSVCVQRMDQDASGTAPGFQDVMPINSNSEFYRTRAFRRSII